MRKVMSSDRSTEGMTRRTWNGTAYIDRGRGDPMLLIHGVGLNAEAWAPQIEAFAPGNRVIAIDMLGHGESAMAPADATLDAYVEQAATLIDELNLAGVTVVGHSMGGLVAIGLALAKPDRVARLAVLNSVYERGNEASAAVEARAAEISAGGSSGDIEQPLSRWFGDEQSKSRAAVRRMLQSVEPQGYAAAYRVFATSDRAFAGRLPQLAMPALFATGSDDPNSTAAMAQAMASATPRGKAAVLDGQRHMMNLTDPEATNTLIRNLLAEPPMTANANELRRAFGTFMTGVTIVTTLDENGSPRGFTANSFTSVSLDPPLLLICIGKKASSYQTFSKAAGFAVNILGEKQKTASSIFASKRPDKFADVGWHAAPSGYPLIDGSVAWFDCARHTVVDAGDHIIVLGAIRAFDHSDANPLGYARGGYVSLGLEQAAVNAASGGHTVVGAILECDGKLVLAHDQASNQWRLPEVGHGGHSGSASLLCETLRLAGVNTDLGFLFAVYETPQTKIQSIYYRGDATLRGKGPYTLVAFEAIDWAKLPDEPTRIMLRRYARERLEGRFKIYSGDHERGEVRPLA
jgi:flavin reductase (DIM6/NTAB) family NADH-FMN oxidoreductase RutF/pimeloyl-ACP methyl ester carboxylesterase